jgi:hypothetical protein
VMAGAPGQLYSAMPGLHPETGRLDGEARGAMLHDLESCACVFLCLFLAACLGGPGDGNGLSLGLSVTSQRGMAPGSPVMVLARGDGMFLVGCRGVCWGVRAGWCLSGLSETA